MSGNQVIPEAAVDAAARAVFLTAYPGGCGVTWDPNGMAAQGMIRDVRVALEAAAPHMLASVWDEAIEAHKAWTWDDENMDPLPNPYRPTP